MQPKQRLGTAQSMIEYVRSVSSKMPKSTQLRESSQCNQTNMPDLFTHSRYVNSRMWRSVSAALAKPRSCSSGTHRRVLGEVPGHCLPGAGRVPRARLVICRYIPAGQIYRGDRGGAPGCEVRQRAAEASTGGRWTSKDSEDGVQHGFSFRKREPL